MKFTITEMNGLLNGKCIPTDLLVGETLSAYLVRKLSHSDQQLTEATCYGRQADITIENLERKVAMLAAENAVLKAALNPEVIPDAAVEAFTETAVMDHDWNDTGEYSWVENETDVIRAVLEAIKPETPATDAYRDELRAQGIEMAAKSDQFSMWVQQGLRSFAIGVRQGGERELSNLERNVLECAAVIAKDREQGGAAQ